jgi:glycosyltransferase involved in cell wall biosynthesis
VQRRQLKRVAFVVGASEVFVRSIESDYGVPASRTRVVRHPVDLDHYADVPRPVRRSDEPLQLLFASRLSARKGLEMVIELSHRLDDLAGQVNILILGGASMWSDYTAHLADRNPRVAQPAQALQARQMKTLYANVDVVLAPSHWEPFSLVTAEALAAGVPVVASDQIGAAEGVDPSACRVFRAGDMDAFEAEVRALVAELREPGAGERLAERARVSARARFDAGGIGADLHEVLDQAAATPFH